MKSEREIKMLRCSKGFFTMREMVEALEKEGITMTRQAYLGKEKGRHPFKIGEVKALAKILGLSIEEAIYIFT